MRAELSSHIENLFFEALEKPTHDHRAAFLDETCPAQPGVRSRVEALLSAHEQAEDFLTRPVFEVNAEAFLVDELVIATDPTRVDTDTGRFDQDLHFLESPRNALEIGRFANYSIVEFLGRGGAGIVLKARDEQLHRIVAIKVLAPEWAAQSQARERFLREARSAAAVRHENVVAIHAIDETAQLPFLVLEYIEGPTLQDWLTKRVDFSLAEMIRISIQVSAGLAAAHAQRLIHRDIKPANILIEQSTGNVKLTDFGLARAADDARLTQEGLIAGTPQYMSPEQAQGHPVDHRSDLFSLGCVMYALCAGHPPFRAPTTLAVLRMICDEQASPLKTGCPQVPPRMAELIDGLLQKDPDKRPQTALEVVARLEELLNETEGKSNIASAIPQSRRPLVAGLVLMSLPLVAGLFYKIWNFDVTEEGRIPPQRVESSQQSSQPQTQNLKPPRPQSLAMNAQPSKPVLDLFEESIAPFGEIRRMTVPGVRFYGLVVSPDGRRVYASATDKHIYCWNTEDGEEVFRLEGHTGMSQHLSISPDGSQLVSCGADRTLRLWNTETGKEIFQYSSTVPIRSAVFSPDGKNLALAFVGGAAANRMVTLYRKSKEPNRSIGLAVGPHQIHVIDVETSERHLGLATSKPSQYYDLAWSPDGRYLAAGTDGGQVVVFDTTSGKPPKTLTASGVPGPAYGIRFSADGQRLYAAGSGNLVWCWSWPPGSEIFSRRFQNGVVHFDLSSNGRWLAMGGGLEVRLWDLKDPHARDLLRKLEGHTSPVGNVAFIPDHDVLVSCGWDGSVRLWRLPQF